MEKVHWVSSTFIVKDYWVSIHLLIFSSNKMNWGSNISVENVFLGNREKFLILTELKIEKKEISKGDVL